MAQEIERKFLVKGDFKPEVYKSIRITQGYLSSVPERTVRVRIKGEQDSSRSRGKGITPESAVMNGKKKLL